MLYSKIFGKTSKTPPSDDAVNAKLLTQGGFVVKQMAGVYNYLPLGLRVLTKIQNIIREEMNAIGGNEVLLPALTLEENYAASGQDNIDILFHLEGHGGSKLVINQSHENVVTPLAKLFTFSYRDLPLYVYQIQNKFRNEPRAKSGLLRGREFNMKDLYSFHASVEDFQKYYETVKDAYFKIYDRVGLGERVVLTFASGGVFSKFSHEFQALADIGEDTVYLCEKCRIAVNKEVYAEQNTCPNCKNSDLTERRAIEVGNIFDLKTRFTDAFDFKFIDATGKPQPILMGCYGIGVSRLMGTLVEIFHDDQGIVWPEAVAPFKVHLVALGKEPEAKAEAEKIYQELTTKGVEVLYDDREVSAGEKLGDADLIGIPYRVVVSKKTLAVDAVEMKKRNEAEAQMVPLEKIVSLL
ncbi:MAG: aminoacyl--tRNA ligase-related protein [bacterium]|nr:aminoacyl--tRNA ligase-related protein [bacterium]